MDELLVVKLLMEGPCTTVNVALFVAPPQFTEYVVLDDGLTVIEPDVPVAVKFVPVQLPASVEFQLSVALVFVVPPDPLMLVGFTEIEAVGHAPDAVALEYDTAFC